MGGRPKVYLTDTNKNKQKNNDLQPKMEVEIDLENKQSINQTLVLKLGVFFSRFFFSGRRPNEYNDPALKGLFPDI